VLLCACVFPAVYVYVCYSAISMRAISMRESVNYGDKRSRTGL